MPYIKYSGSSSGELLPIGCPVRTSIGWWGYLLSYGIFVLLFVFVLLSFYRENADNSDVMSTSMTYVRLLTELGMLSFVGLRRHNFSGKKPLLLIVFLWSLWMPIANISCLDSGRNGVISSISILFYCPLVFLFFYSLVNEGVRWFTITRRMFLLLLAVVACMFFYYLNVDSLEHGHGGGFSLINNAYYALLLLPWVLISRNVLLRHMGTALIAFIILWSMKRTGLIALVVSVLSYLMAESWRLRLGRNIRGVFGGIAIIMAALILFSLTNEEAGYYLKSRINAIESDRGAGRLDIYEDVLYMQSNLALGGWVFGNGHDAVKQSGKIRGGDELVSAHNDWLEVLYDYGLVGLALHIIFVYLLLRQTWILLNRRSWFGPPMVASCVIFLILSLTSHLVLYASYYSYLMAFWGAICAAASFEGTPHKQGLTPMHVIGYD